MNAAIAVEKHILKTVPSVMRVIRSEMKQVAKSHLSIPQFRILAHLCSGESTPSALADLQGVSLPAMSKMLDILASRKHLRRRPSPHDGRSQIVELLPKGRVTFESLKENVEILLRPKFERLTPNEIKLLTKALLLLDSIFAAEEGSGH
jgi:MarR family transcriptional regulator for hemolysin